jgi:hypothetical protein
VPTIWSKRIFQYKGFTVSRDIPVQNFQSVRIYPYKIFSKKGYSSTQNAAHKDFPV